MSVVEAVGQILTSAIAATISPIAIVLVTLLLVSKRARVSAPAYALGWFVGTFATVGIATTLADGAGVASEAGARDGFSVVQLLLGLLFLMLAVKAWKGRPRDGIPTPEPKIFSTVGTLGPVKAFGLGLVIATIFNPKNLALEIGAGGTIAEAGLSAGGDLVTIVIFAVLASLMLAGPVVAALILGERSAAPLAETKEWLVANNATIMLVLFSILSARSIGHGLGLFG